MALTGPRVALRGKFLPVELGFKHKKMIWCFSLDVLWVVRLENVVHGSFGVEEARSAPSSAVSPTFPSALTGGLQQTLHDIG
ncbi:hypothetical protein DV515_00011593 [Chloebia gouldiae]|uniref:Uncharacterized protein n=1 Tax=Chloebia gouldiae TaxID=44316 RepID=A0A3L8S5S0_CHLGU|nr:hypothetical protein DV515_00011593 [Chloebia gouldiae]